MAIGVTHVHLPNAPGHVGGRPGDVETLLQAAPMDGVHVPDPDRHPGALVRGLVALGAKRHLHSAVPPPSLCTLTQEDLAVAGAHTTEGRRRAPLPALGPSELLEPREA